MSTQTVIHLPNHVSGDTFEGFQFNGKNELGAIYDLTNCTLSVAFRYGIKDTGTIQKTMSIGDGLEWVTQSSGIFKISEQSISWPAGMYYYEVEITFPDTTTQSPIVGTWKINPQGTP